MGRRSVAIGSIGVIFLLTLTIFSSSVCSQKVQYNEMQKNVFPQIRNEILAGLPPWALFLSYIIDLIIAFILNL